MISQTAEYALRAVVFLAQHHGTPRTAHEIAEATKVPQGYLAKIMQALAKRSLVHSQRGLGGGFILTREPGEISVYDVLVAADTPPQRIHECPLGLKGHVALCPVHKLMDDAMARIEEGFRAASIGQLLKSTKGSKPLCDVDKLAAPAASRGKGK